MASDGVFCVKSFYLPLRRWLVCAVMCWMLRLNYVLIVWSSSSPLSLPLLCPRPVGYSLAASCQFVPSGAGARWNRGTTDAALPAVAGVTAKTARELGASTVVVWGFMDYHPFEVPPTTFDVPNYCSCV